MTKLLNKEFYHSTVKFAKFSDDLNNYFEGLKRYGGFQMNEKFN